MKYPFATLIASSLAISCPVWAQSDGPITAEGINTADYAEGTLPDGQSAVTARLQVLLDRAHASPGVIDGYMGENVEKAVRAFEEMKGFQVDGEVDGEVWQALQTHAGDAFVRHTISEEDIARIVEPLPEDYAELAERDWLGYTSAAEKIAERFHMDVEFLEKLNPSHDFSSVGTEIWVADPGENAKPRIGSIVADKSLARLLAYDDTDKLVLSYPVTIGSEQLPSPTGTHEVKGIAIEPTYAYRPDENFQQGENDEPLTLPPGPNNPVGLVWIDLSEPTYGIHGTPEPAEIDKTSSHGCVRMTNWDAMELAEAVETGVSVIFQE